MDHKVSKEDIIQRVIDAGFVLIDDYGKEEPIKDTINIFYRIINARYRMMRPMIFTSNWPLSGIENRLNELGNEKAGAIASRLEDMCVQITFPEVKQRGFK